MATKIRTVSRSTLEEAAELASSYEAEVRTYSGRGMFGAECAAVVLESDQEMCKFFLALGALTAEKALYADPEDVDPTSDATDLAASVRTDSMGLGVVVYFPGWALEG